MKALLLITCNGLGDNNISPKKGPAQPRKEPSFRKRSEQGKRSYVSPKALVARVHGQDGWLRTILLHWLIWRYPQPQLQFLLRSVWDTFPSRPNLNRWALAESPNCNLCRKRGTLENVLTSCQLALTQGRYTWRHDKDLRELADVLETEQRRNSKATN